MVLVDKNQLKTIIQVIIVIEVEKKFKVGNYLCHDSDKITKSNKRNVKKPH